MACGRSSPRWGGGAGTLKLISTLSYQLSYKSDIFLNMIVYKGGQRKYKGLFF